MNKKALTFLGGTAGFIFALSACSGGTYEYTVSGNVVDQQIDYTCPKRTLSMEAVAFTVGHHKSNSSSKSSSSKSKSKSGSGKVAKKPTKASGTASSPKPAKTSSTGTGKKTISSTPSPARTASATPSPKRVRNKGVTLSSKPDKAEKLRTLPKALAWRKGCKVDDYEIFVVDRKGDLYEQDVRKADYKNCLRARVPKGQTNKLFPLCTRG